mgnify:CR=1 FL=1
MDADKNIIVPEEKEVKTTDIVYNSDKDFYKGLSGELRFKAEGLFKKAKEKGISIEDICITTLKENSEEFPGLGNVELPTFIVQVRGRHIASGQIIVDGKQIDYYNRYKKYVAEKLEYKNALKDERGKKLKENGRIKLKDNLEFMLSDWEKFEIGKSLVDDKEFGLEKTITGACDRVIRKLMGENDWLYPEEARLLDEEYSTVEGRIARDSETKKLEATGGQKKATDRQINYLKARIKNLGLDPENNAIMKEILKQTGFESKEVSDLTTGDMSRLIENVGNIVQKIKELH